MFGKGKMNREQLQNTKEALELLIDQTAKSAGLFEANSSAIESSQKQMVANLNQVADNLQATSALAHQNIAAFTDLSGSVKDAIDQMEQSENEYLSVMEQFRTLTDNFLDLVEQNKHFTSPSKHISEGVFEMHVRTRECKDAVEELRDTNKQLGIMALNAAIEAGRMGENGKQFVTAAESIRNYAVDFETAITSVENKLAATEEQFEKLQEEVRHLVTLLKDNNISTGKLLKQSQSTVKLVEQVSVQPFSPLVSRWKEVVTGTRNTEEEILKLQERNRIQLEDIANEMQVQRKATIEIEDELVPIFTDAKEYIAGKENN